MAEVTVEVAGRSYRVGCGEGEEEHLRRLGALIDAEARTLLRQFGSLPEGRLLLMTALLIADRLADTERELEAARAGALDPERERALAERLDALAEKAEAAVDAD